MKSKDILIIFIFFLLSIVLYFYKFQKMLTFDADQEFYANQYVQIAKNHKLTLIGIQTSLGRMFVGPLYTYFSTFIYWIFKGNPVGIFLITLFFVSSQASLAYWLFTIMKNRKIGIIAGFLSLFSFSLWSKAFSPSVINFIFPIGLLFLYSLTQVADKNKHIILLSLLLGLSLHLHFSLWIFFPIILIFFIQRHLINKKTFPK